VKFGTARLQPLQRSSSRAVRRVGLAALLILIATEGLQTASADGETRTLSIYHTHTRESIDIVYKRNGRYDDAALAKLNYFLRDWRNDEPTKMDPRLFDTVWEVYQDVGGKEPIQIISAYRSPKTNAMLRRRSRGVAKFSQHMLGKAMDFNIPGVGLDKIRAAGLRQQRGGVGFYPTSGSPFVHLDVGSIRHWPRMTHDQLARVFPDGRTVHVGTDGRPLSGYSLALADVARRNANPSYTAIASARRSGVETASAEKPKRTWFARMFKGGTDEEEEERDQRAPSRDRQAPDAAPTRTTQMAAAVPMPRSRPRDRDQAGALVASARPTTPAQVVMARGFWQASDVIAATESAPAPKRVPANVQRLVWQVGPQPVATGDGTVVTKRAPAPRPRPEVVMASAAETTASVPWPINGREDRVPSDLVMAYAAPTPPPVAQPAMRPAPMGSLRPGPAAAARKPAPAPAKTAAAPARMQAPIGRLGDNPWLRGVMVSPSVQSSMDVTVFGPPNYRVLVALMHKPSSAVANAFADEPEFGLSTTAFTGRAVSFIPTIVFGTITAGLN
jgi:uncharacterized protein YcbK (DUF882 family)